MSSGPPNKTLHTNRRPALGFGLSYGLFEAGRPHHVIVRAAVGGRFLAPRMNGQFTISLQIPDKSTQPAA